MSRSLVSTLLFFFILSPKCLVKGFGGSHMYTLEPPILYPEALPAEDSPRSASKLITRFVGNSMPDAVRSFFGGFSSTSGYVPGNEALVRRRERRSTSGMIISLAALSVFIPPTPVRLAADLSKPFGFGSERTKQRLSAPSALERSRHRVRSTSRCRSKFP